jgi:hypothetical protein
MDDLTYEENKIDKKGICFFIKSENGKTEKLKFEDITHSESQTKAIEEGFIIMKFFPYGVVIDHFGKKLEIKPNCFD